MKKVLLLSIVVSSLCLFSCTDDDSFTTNPSARLTFTSDTISFDTVFATVPTATRSFWVYNRGSDGIRLSSIRLAGGNQKGFRVNVDGAYLGASTGFQVSDVEIRKGDSLRVFVELTSPSPSTEFSTLTDELQFQHESGTVQTVTLTACAWQARAVRNHHVATDEVWTGEQPIIVYGSLTIDEGARLTLSPGTKLYFHGDAAMEVYGTLICDGTATDNVIIRGDRLDNMFDYLPYDRVSGQWKGIVIHKGSHGNAIRYTDIHSTMTAIEIEETDATETVLTLESSTIHNCQGYGLHSKNATVVIANCQISNTLHDCLHVEGGLIDINNTTIAQFYPFDSARGYALYFDNTFPLRLRCRNSVVTGYADDVVQGTQTDPDKDFIYYFSHSILRTTQPEEEQMAAFDNVQFEDIEAEEQGGKFNFVLVDVDSLRYDFHLTETSLAVDAADPETATATDRNGLLRDDKPDMGCFERIKEE